MELLAQTARRACVLESVGLPMPSPGDRDRERLTCGRSELDDVGPIALGAKDHDPVVASHYRRLVLCHSSSASRFTAGAAAFFILSQSGERPERYIESFRFDTMPSSPILHAWAKTVGPSPSMCSLKRRPRPALASILRSVALRTSSGSRRISLPFNSIRSDRLALYGCEQILSF